MAKKPKQIKKPRLKSRRLPFTSLRFVNFALIFSIIGVVYLFFALAAQPEGLYGSVEADQVNRINNHRASHGLAAVKHVECLNKLAERQAEKMANQKTLFHTADLAGDVSAECHAAFNTAGFGPAGEILGKGGVSSAVFNAYLNSSTHHHIIDTAAYNRIGAGAYYKPATGEYYIVEIFVKCTDCSGEWAKSATVAVDPTVVLPAAAGWGSWENLAGGTPSGNAPAASSTGDRRIDLFLRGTGSSSDMYQKSFDGTSWASTWTNLGGDLNSYPASVSMNSNRTDVFALNASNAVMQNTRNGNTWTGWKTIGTNTAVAASAPAVASWGDGRLDLFYTGSNAHVYTRSSNGSTWTAASDQGATVQGAPAVVSWASGRIDLFAKDLETNSLLHKFFNASSGSWSAWEDLGGSINSAPTVASWGSGRLDVFARGAYKNDVVHKYYSAGKWSGWETLGGVVTGPPAAVSWGTGRIDVFARDTNGAIVHKFIQK